MLGVLNIMKKTFMRGLFKKYGNDYYNIIRNSFNPKYFINCGEAIGKNVLKGLNARYKLFIRLKKFLNYNRIIVNLQ